MGHGRAGMAVLACAIALACGPRGKDGSKLPKALHGLADANEISRASVDFEVAGATLWRVQEKYRGAHDKELSDVIVGVAASGQLLAGKALFVRAVSPDLEPAAVISRAIRILDAPGMVPADASGDAFSADDLALVRPPHIRDGAVEYWATGRGMAYGNVSRVRITLATGDVEQISAHELRAVPKLKPPTIVELPPRDPTPEDCTASGPDAPVLDWNSPLYDKIEVRRGAQILEEQVTLRDRPVTVTVRVGGCAHYGAYYQVTYADERPATELAHHVARALDIVGALAFRDGATTYLDDIAPPIRAAVAAGTSLAECTFSVGDITTVMCGVSSPREGHITVMLGYDVAL